jgi:hypothetical protein
MVLIKFRNGIEPAPTMGKSPMRAVRFQQPQAFKNPIINTEPQQKPHQKLATSSERRNYGTKMESHEKNKTRVHNVETHERSKRSRKITRKRDEVDSDSEEEEVKSKSSKSRSRKTSFHEKPGRKEAEEGERESRHAPQELKEVVMDGKKLRLKKFQVESMMRVARNPSVCFIAKRGSGKSFLLRHIMNVYKDIPGGNVISLSERLNDFFKDFFPELFVFETFDSEIIENLLERQERIKDKSKRRVAAGKRPLDTRAWLIMDDCLSQAGSWAKKPAIAEVMMNGRHYDLFYVLTMQYPLGIGPDLRINFDFVFLFGENYSNIRRKIYDHYAGMFPTYAAFEKVFAKATSNFGCLVINNRIKSEHIEDICSWFRAEDTKIDGFLGSKSFVRQHTAWFNKDHAKKSKQDKQHFSADKLRGKRSNAPVFDIELCEEDNGSKKIQKKQRKSKSSKRHSSSSDSE